MRSVAAPVSLVRGASYDHVMSETTEGWSGVDVLPSLLRPSTPRGIDVTQVVELGGVPQVVNVRGKDRANPVLLFVHGGPGTPLAATAWMWQRPVEEFFTVVHYDQRGAGRSFALSDPSTVRESMRVADYVRDAVELAEWLRDELAVDRVIIAGHSWGTVVATQAVIQRPELFSTYLGIGQVVDFRASEAASFEWVLSEARRRGNDEAVAELSALAPYPKDGQIELQSLITERKWVGLFGGFAAGRSDCDYYTLGGVASPDYTAAELAGAEDGNRLTLEVVLPQLMAVDLTGLRQFPVPVVQFIGRHDYMTPAGPVLDWISKMTAPEKTVVWFEDSAHMIMYEEPGRFLLQLVRHLRPELA